MAIINFQRAATVPAGPNRRNILCVRLRNILLCLAGTTAGNVRVQKELRQRPIISHWVHDDCHLHPGRSPRGCTLHHNVHVALCHGEWYRHPYTFNYEGDILRFVRFIPRKNGNHFFFSDFLARIRLIFACSREYICYTL